MHRRATVLTFLLLCAWPAAPLHGTDSQEVSVTYLAGDSVYVAAGELDGLDRGVILEGIALSGEQVKLTVSEVGAHRSVCTITEGSRDAVSVGDRFRYTSAVVPGQNSLEGDQPKGSGLWKRSGLRGRAGLRYLATRNQSGNAEFNEPAADLRLDGNALFGSAFNLHTDVRARRTSRTRSDGSDDTSNDERIYRLTFGWDRPGTGWRFAAGRQFSPDLANVSVFDGISGAYDSERWSAGLFAGTQPDGSDYAFSSDVREYGGFFKVGASSGAPRRWALTTGLVGSYEESEINREYIFVQGRYSTERLTGFLTQEIDFNRGWREDAGDSGLSFTSTFVSLRFRMTEKVRIRGGYDSRRRVRLYRDRVTPETEFDDAFRRGAWLGGSVDVGKHFRLGVDARANRSGPAGDSNAYTLKLGARRLFSRDGAVRLRSTRYENDRVEGWLHTLDLSIDVVQRVRLGVFASVRDDESLLNSELNDSVAWYGLDADIDLGRSLYLTLSAERSEGDFEEIDQLYATLAFRF